ncbi:MAG: alanine:cation symporter family protein, partial [Ruminococcaceae bacterium]|nr:alanine:cation symporter family protein [Oscillospiraceae bacterium]
RMGVTRGIVSNEAGCGTAPIAHAAAKVEHPAEQGVWGIFEVFIDTIVICTLTAYVVLISHRHGITLSADGMTTAARALGAFIPHADVILCAAVLVFAFCTIICWFHYGAESLAALSHRPAIRRLYALLYAASAGFGCIISGGIVWSLADLFISAMTAVNIVAILLRVKEIKSETDNYFGKSSCKFGNKPIPKLHFSVAKSRKMW